MDFEEQLEHAEQLPEPTLVGSSIRSADDSAHNNYIHPEKYKSSKDKKKKKKSTTSKSSAAMYNSSITTSLDDLISEGALLGSDENFDNFLDAEGHVKDDAKYARKVSSSKKKSKKKKVAEEEEDEDEDANDTRESLQDFLKSEPKIEGEPSKESLQDFLDNEKDLIPEAKDADEPEFKSLAPPPVATTPVAVSSAATPSSAVSSAATPSSGFYQQEDYSTPNLSEYQLENQINSHQDLLSNVKSHDPQRLPKLSADASKTPSYTGSTPGTIESRKPTSFTTPAKEAEFDLPVAASEDSIHTPYFHTERDRSRSRSAVPNVRSNERSLTRTSAPHLARGDSYKSTHFEDPSSYELPPLLGTQEDLKDVAEETEEVDDRRSRQSRPTMGESIAKAEAEAVAAASTADHDDSKFVAEKLSKDPSLVTSGDYTNFNVDNPTHELPVSARLYATRSESSTNYLRSISRSRSRAPRGGEHHDEKTDSNPEELVREGALVNDDPYTTVDHLDEMVQSVLLKDKSPRHRLAETTDVEGTDGTPRLRLAETTDIEANDGSPRQRTPQVTENEVKDGSPRHRTPQVTTESDYDEEQEKLNAQLESLAIKKEKVKEEVEPLTTAEVAEDKAKDSNEGVEVAEVAKTEEDITTAEPVEESKSAEFPIEEKSKDTEEDLVSKLVEHESPSKDLVDDEIASKDADKEIPVSKEVKLEDSVTKMEHSASSEETEKVTEHKSPVSLNTADDDVTANESEDYVNISKDEVPVPKAIEDKSSHDHKSGETLVHKELSVDDESSETQEVTKEVNSEVLDEAAAEAKSEVTSKDIDHDSETAEELDVETSPKKELATETATEVVSEDTPEEAEHVSEVTPKKDELESEAAGESDLTSKDVEVDSDAIVKKPELESDSKETELDDPKETDSKETEVETDPKETELESVPKETELDSEKSTEPESDTKETEPAPEKPSTGIFSAITGAAALAPAALAPTEPTLEAKAKAADDDDLDFDISPAEIRKHLEAQPIYIFTSLAGGMQIMPRTNRLATILNANGIKFTYRDLGTDDEAKKIWRRSAGGKPLPGVVRGDDFIGNFAEIDEANEQFRLQEILYETL